MYEVTCFLGDCLYEMDKIRNNSIDMILTDLPYGTTQNSWDSNIDLKRLWKQYLLIIKENGCIALFAQAPFDKEWDTQKSSLHPTQKPVAMLEYFIKTYTNEGDVVLDSCMGSGSTGIACKNTNRKFIGIEMDKNYFNIALNRLLQARREDIWSGLGHPV